MLVSGGKILAIDQVYTDNRTISGDGVQKPLYVNTDVIATNATVSSVSSILNQNITNVSSTLNQEITNVSSVLNQNITNVSADLENYYTKAETTSAINDALDGVIKHETEVSAQDIAGNIIAVTRTVKEDGTVVFELSAKPEITDTNIIGINGISAEQREDLAWVISYTGKSGNIYSAATPNLDIYEDENHQWWISAAAYPDVSNFLTSAEGYEDEALVLKNNQWVPADDVFATDEDIRNLSATVANTYLSASEFNTYSAGVDTRIDTLEKIAEQYTTTDSAHFETTYETVLNTSAKWNEVSAFSALSGNFMQTSKLESTDDNKLSGYGGSAFYYPQATEYSGGDGIKVENHIISISAKYLSANALDNLSGKWESVYDTVESNSARWNEVSAYSATSGQFVTSALEDFTAGLANVLVKDDENNVTWSGVDLSNLGKMYNISSLTPDLISAGISADEQNNQFYVLSAAKPGEVSVPGISGYGLSAWKDAENDEYKVSANIVGNHGVSAAYDAEANTWNVGISANDYSFLFGHYSNNAVLTDGTVLKLDSNNYHGIDIDNDGYITLPETVNKFTFCINEYIDDNTIQAHSYLLNKLVLSAKGNDQIVASQNYYPSEVGASNVTLALTIDATTAPNREYCIVYKGSDVAVNKLHIEASILEEVTSLDSTGGAAQDYTGQNPIRVVDNSKVIQLLYDSNVFSLKRDEQLQADILTIEGTGGETVDKEAFDKLLKSINGRLTETIPFGALDTMADFASGKQYTYLFRPTIEYELSNKTVARMFGGNGEAAHVSVALYDVNDADRSDGTLLWNSLETVRGTASELILSADPNAPTGNTISPDHTYRVSVRITNEAWHNVLGTHIYGTIDTSIGNPAPWQGEGNKNNHNWPNTFLQSTPGSMDNFGSNKPYVSFRTEE